MFYSASLWNNIMVADENIAKIFPIWIWKWIFISHLKKYTHFYFWLLEKSRCLRLFRVVIVIEITTLSWFHNQLWSDCDHIITDWGCFESLHGNARQIETISYFFLRLQNYKVRAVICIEIQSLCSYVR